MNPRLLFFPLLLISFLFISATTVSVDPTPVKGKVSPEITSVAASVKKSKIGFFERLLLKLVQHKFKKAEDTTKADKQASNSLTFGIIAVSALLVGLIVPYVMFATIPAGIVAMSTGNAALKSGTKETGKAHTGKSLGLGSLIAFGALLLVALVVVAAFFSWN